MENPYDGEPKTCPDCGAPLGWQEHEGELTAFCPCWMLQLSETDVKYAMKRALNIGINGKPVKCNISWIRGPAITAVRNYINKKHVGANQKLTELKEIAVLAAENAHSEGRKLIDVKDVNSAIMEGK